MIELRFLPPIPKGKQLYRSFLSVAGIGYRKKSSYTFAKGRGQYLTLEAEPDNEYDPNAVKVIGWFTDPSVDVIASTQLGYVEKGIAEVLVQDRFLGMVEARLKSIKVVSLDHEVQFDLVGPKAEAERFKQNCSTLPTSIHVTADVEPVTYVDDGRRIINVTTSRPKPSSCGCTSVIVLLLLSLFGCGGCIVVGAMLPRPPAPDVVKGEPKGVEPKNDNDEPDAALFDLNKKGTGANAGKVWISGYLRNGVWVEGHFRNPPGAGPSKTPHPTTSKGGKG